MSLLYSNLSWAPVLLSPGTSSASLLTIPKLHSSAGGQPGPGKLAQEAQMPGFEKRIFWKGSSFHQLIQPRKHDRRQKEKQAMVVKMEREKRQPEASRWPVVTESTYRPSFSLSPMSGLSSTPCSSPPSLWPVVWLVRIPLHCLQRVSPVSLRVARLPGKVGLRECWLCSSEAPGKLSVRFCWCGSQANLGRELAISVLALTIPNQTQETPGVLLSPLPLGLSPGGFPRNQ